MSKTTWTLHRRTLLRGLAGAALALPALEIMTRRRAHAGNDAPPPKRFVLMYGGMSLLSDGQPDQIVPDQVGADYDLKRAALALGAGPLPSNPGVGGNGFDVRDHVSIVSGLKVPWSSAGGDVPPGGRSPEFHYNTMGPQTSGVRGPSFRKEEPSGPTADQLVADAIAGDTTFSSLSLRVQASSYQSANTSSTSAARISYRVGPGGSLVAIEPVASPQALHDTLFGNFVPPDPADADDFARRAALRRSVVDLVHARAETLHARLGSADRQRFERHLDEVRALELRLDTMPPPTANACERPAEPGDDPPIGAGYSDENLRAELLGDYVRMAFACDLSRVAAIRMSFSGSSMQGGPLVGHEGDLHNAIGHGGRAEAHADCLGWHVKQFARMVAALRDTPEHDGSSVLDHTAIVMLFEGGWGYDAESNVSSLNPHSTENMIALVGGHAGGLNPGGGRHIVKTNAHPANAVVSAMAAVGAADDEQLGDVQGLIPELFA